MDDTRRVAWRLVDEGRVRITQGEDLIRRFSDGSSTRSFCSQCGTPLLYERSRSPKMVNIPRALFTDRTGREPRYHIAIDELQDWAYTGAALGPLKGFPGVVWERPKKPAKAKRAL